MSKHTPSHLARVYNWLLLLHLIILLSTRQFQLIYIFLAVFNQLHDTWHLLSLSFHAISSHAGGPFAATLVSRPFLTICLSHLSSSANKTISLSFANPRLRNFSSSWWWSPLRGCLFEARNEPSAVGGNLQGTFCCMARVKRSLTKSVGVVPPKTAHHWHWWVPFSGLKGRRKVYGPFSTQSERGHLVVPPF